MSAALTVDQSLVDAYLERVERFVSNVDNFSQTLKSLKDKFVSAVSEKPEPVYQETVASTPEQATVTADEIDLDELLKGVDLNGMSL